MFSEVGKMLVIAGLALVLLGGILWLSGKVPSVGRLPGDVHVEKETSRGRFSFYFPIATCILLSIFLTLLLNLIFRMKR